VTATFASVSDVRDVGSLPEEGLIPSHRPILYNVRAVTCREHQARANARNAPQALGVVPTSLEHALCIRSSLDDALAEPPQPKPTSQPSTQQVTAPPPVKGRAELVSLKVNVFRGIMA
jgi:hypothetical protein